MALTACAVLSILPLHAFAHGRDDGDTVLGGVLGGVVGGIIGSAIAPPYTVYETRPVIVERYDPPPRLS
ncbi:MAG: hypothetical protein WCA32_13635 [Chromatiaceae bacterium]